MKDVKDHVVYERKITIPAVDPEQAVKLAFGSVTHGCEVFLDGKKVGEHHGPQVAFELDLTPFATPGKEQTLTVKAYHRQHYVKPGENKTSEVATGWDYESAIWGGPYAGKSKVAYGIGRYVKLVVLPAVHVADWFVHPSVAKKEWSCDVWLENATDKERTIRINAAFASWNQSGWKYPAIPAKTVTLPAKSMVKTTLGPVAWNLGPESYWWPNIPFREDYRAQLHNLNLEIAESDKVWERSVRRFGFVEHAEGPHYYTVNGVRVTGFSDGTAEGGLSCYDAYGASPAFLPPTKPGTGCPETWKRYLRAGMNINRLHCSPPTEYMMQAADEVGFMLIPEAPIWGNHFSRYNPQYTPQTYFDLGRTCRNHPCVARYALANEVREPRLKLKDQWPWRPAIDDIRKADDTRPLVFEMHRQGSGRVDGIQGGHAWIMDHYTDIREKVGDGKGIRGMGEHFWSRNSMGEFAVGARTLRVNGWCYMAGWCWINYWPNFLEGMCHKDHAWKLQNHPDRTDGIDGWGSPIVEFTRNSLHPYLVQDIGLLKENPGDPKLLPDGKIQWPYQLPTLLAGQSAERKIEIFNNGLTGNQITLRWRAHWDSPTGPEAVKGGDIPCVIEPGFHATQTIAFTVPKIAGESRKLCLVLESLLDGKTVFRSEETQFNVLSRQVEPAAIFLSADDKTQGDWEGQFGSEGHELIGRENKLPAYVKFAWKSGKEWIYDKGTSAKQALAFFPNVPTGKDRIAAARCGDELEFTLDAGQTPRRLSLYFLDYDNKGRKQTVEFLDAQTGKSLNKQDVGDFANGKYLSWKIQGAIKCVIRKTTGDTAVINGVFLDPTEK